MISRVQLIFFYRYSLHLGSCLRSWLSAAAHSQERDQFRRPVPVLDVLVAEFADQVSLFIGDGDHDKGSQAGGHAQVRDGHGGREPHSQHHAEIQWVAHVLVVGHYPEL